MNDSLQIMLHGVGYSELIFTDGSILPINKSQNIDIKVDATTAEIEGGDGFYALLQYITKKTGTVDIDNAKEYFTNFENTKEFTWMQNNAYKYGFILRFPKDKVTETGYEYESWHYRYVGV